MTTVAVDRNNTTVVGVGVGDFVGHVDQRESALSGRHGHESGGRSRAVTVISFRPPQSNIHRYLQRSDEQDMDQRERRDGW